jgi:hypothetical protein
MPTKLSVVFKSLSTSWVRESANIKAQNMVRGYTQTFAWLLICCSMWSSQPQVGYILTSHMECWQVDKLTFSEHTVTMVPLTDIHMICLGQSAGVGGQIINLVKSAKCPVKEARALCRAECWSALSGLSPISTFTLRTKGLSYTLRNKGLTYTLRTKGLSYTLRTKGMSYTLRTVRKWNPFSLSLTKQETDCCHFTSAAVGAVCQSI